MFRIYALLKWGGVDILQKKISPQMRFIERTILKNFSENLLQKVTKGHLNMGKLKTIFSIIIYFIVIESVVPQQPHTEWIQRYNSSGNYNEDLVDMVLDKYGNAYLTGNTGNPSDIVTLKYNSSGNLQWARLYNGPTNREDVAVRIAVDDSGFVYVAGKTFRPIEFTNFLIIKYSSDGNVVWNREYNYGDSTTEVPRDMVIDNFSNIFITGDGGICGGQVIFSL